MLCIQQITKFTGHIMFFNLYIHKHRHGEFEDSMLVWVCAVGFISLCCHLFAFLRWFYKMFIRSPKDLLDYGSWAVITGSTDGIGKALAFELASKGLNLVCVGRNPAKLESTATEIHHKFGPGVEIRNITLDFNKSGPSEILSTLEDEIRGLDIGLLVNNVGIAYYPRFLHEVDQKLMDTVVRVNVESAVWVTKAVIPHMMMKKKGAIVNIGSGSSGSVASYPLYTLYAASKAFMATFSRSIGLEYGSYGIDIQCQAPLYVSTKMSGFGTNLLVPSAEMYAKSSVRWMGYDALCSPFWSHCLQSQIARCLPDALVSHCLFQISLRIRRAAMKKRSTRQAYSPHS